MIELKPGNICECTGCSITGLHGCVYSCIISLIKHEAKCLWSARIILKNYSGVNYNTYSNNTIFCMTVIDQCRLLSAEELLEL